MMQILVNIDVDDLERGIAFYRDGLGFSLRRRLFDGAVAELAGGGVRVLLLQKPAGSAPAATASGHRDYARHWTPVHLDVETRDIEAARERALAAGAIAEGGITSAAWGRLAPMSDPFGHGFCFIEFSARGYDAAE